MHHLFTPSHVQLLNACYPPTSSLVTAGPAYAPSSHELSRLTYYASNHPGKLTKLGSEVEKRIRTESGKAKSGNIRARASLLISLAILRSLATECRGDIALLSPSLIPSVHVALTSAPHDLEVVARLASVFSAWTTYTNGQLVGADQSFTEVYLSVLQGFADLASSDSADQEVRNRTRLIGFSAVINAFNSEALYNDSRQFRTQASILLRPILVSLFQANLDVLEEQVTKVKENSGAGYLEEFRTRPATERRAASIHIHVDGDVGPSNREVSDAALRALFSLMSHTSGTQMGYIMQSGFDNLDILNGWADQKHCCWLSQQISEWALYQYRYVVPTWLVDRLLENQDAVTVQPMHTTLAAMVNAVLSSSIPMINLSSADLLSKLSALLLRRSSFSPVDPLLQPIVRCISSLACHVYYSDQIQDLAAEIINRLVMVEVQDVSRGSDSASKEARSSSIRCLIGALSGLVKVANEHEHQNSKPVDLLRTGRVSHIPTFNGAERAARRTRISPDIWQDTLSLLCDPDERIRNDYAGSLIYYIEKEMPKQGEHIEADGVRRIGRLNGGLQAANITVLFNGGDSGSQLLSSIHAYVYILVTNPSLAFGGYQVASSPIEDGQPLASSPPSSPQRSQSFSRGIKAKKASLIRRMTLRSSAQEPHIPFGRREDYATVSSILATVQENLPIRGLLTAVPMLLQLDVDVKSRSVDPEAAVGIKNVILDAWTAIGKAWGCEPLLALCEVPSLGSPDQLGIDSTKILDLLVDCPRVAEAFGVPKDTLIARLSTPWDPQGVLHHVDAESYNHYDPTIRGDNLSPLLKISPALMQIDNMSMQSLQSRPPRGLGVTDLREALEGRAAMSNPNLARPSSIVSTLDRASTMTGGDAMAPLSLTPSRKAKRANQGDVKDVLTKLGIGKQNGLGGTNLLKASFPALSKPGSKPHSVPTIKRLLRRQARRESRPRQSLAHTLGHDVITHPPLQPPRKHPAIRSILVRVVGPPPRIISAERDNAANARPMVSVNVLDHLGYLVGDNETPDTGKKDAVLEWTSLDLKAPARSDVVVVEMEQQERWQEESAIWTFVDGSEEYIPSTATADIWKALNRKPNISPLLDALQVTLSKRLSEDQLSGGLIEVLGYGDIELVFQIIPNISVFKKEVEERISFLQRKPLGIDYSNPEDVFMNSRQRIEAQLAENASRPLNLAPEQAAREQLPGVYTTAAAASGNMLDKFGMRFSLPAGTVRESQKEYEEVTIPPAAHVPPRASERLIPVNELDPLARGCFSAYTSLNRIQSIVFNTAYKTNENMLVSAPTGAGKTDVALLAILRTIDQHRTHESKLPLRDSIDRSSFKVIYVAPMKALAAEITRKFGKRLQWLGINVRELTGDMQMTKAEISQTQIIVTTPEKWDVVTRKPTGEGELASSIKLLILDEVHLLNEDRGAVIETIVARTLRQVESSQLMVRILGLSATLPNYVDVSQFLSVNPYKGLFYFDSSFRPVPLEQHFLGIRGKPGSMTSKKNMDFAVFQKVTELVEQGHQVMVFVHARKETVKTAMQLKEMIVAEDDLEKFGCEDHPQFQLFRRELSASRNKEMKLLFDNGFGIHHAGMLRSDRNLMERMFQERAIKVLCCTATLAWGVNLPAHAVIIKGTQIYDTGKGVFTDLSVLDVLQIFGRAGRPGLETSGEGYICTTDDKLQHYLDAVTSQVPIESKFQGGMVDALNAEISLGTVANINDAVQWLGFTYLFVRMKKNPFIYGIARDTLAEDPLLGAKRTELVKLATKRLTEIRMVVADPVNGSLQVTDLGRIAAKYYIRFTSIEIFNKEFRPKMTEADVLAMLSQSTEFGQIQLRETEMEELEGLEMSCPCQVKGGLSAPAGKVNVLLQAYISRMDYLNDFALISDMAYVAQNAGRIIRALLEISISRKWANATAVLMSLSKAIEKRLWPFDHPLKQSQLKAETLNMIVRWCDELTVSELASFDPATIGKMTHLNDIQGTAIHQAAKQFPTARISYKLRPLASDVLKISLVIGRAFKWNSRMHGTTEPFWVWIEDAKGLHILQLSHLVFHENTENLDLEFVLPIPNGSTPSSFTVRWVSDRWMGAEEEIPISLADLVMPPVAQCHTPVLLLPFLPVTCIQPTLASLYANRFSVFNTLQTQTFWTLINSRSSTLVCAPSGAGKTVMAEIVAQSTVAQNSDSWVIVVSSRKSTAQAVYADLRRGSEVLNIRVEYPPAHLALARPTQGGVYVTTPTVILAALSRRRPTDIISGLDLVISDNLEQLDGTYELAISLLQLATQTESTRYVGFADSLNDPSDLASWLNVDPGSLYSFRPRDREQSLKLSNHAFTISHSAALFRAMGKPAHMAISEGLKEGPAIAFVPSRSHCRNIALDLITWATLDSETGRGYLSSTISEDAIQGYRAHLQDQELIDFIGKGVGFYHHGLHKQDRSTVLQLYVEGIIRVLVVPRDACWDLPVRASCVVVMATQYVEVDSETSIRRVRDYKLTDIVRMQSRAVQHNGTGHFHLFCQAEALDTYSRFLTEGLPLESQIMETDTIRNWVRSLEAKGIRLSKQDLFDFLSFSLLSRRVASNPTYYGFTSTNQAENISRLVDQILDAPQVVTEGAGGRQETP